MAPLQRRYHVAMRATPKKKKMISLKQIRSAARTTREARETLKALGLGSLFDFQRVPDTKEVRSMISKVGHLVSILDGPDILFPTGKSTLGVERIREAVEAVRAEQKNRAYFASAARLRVRQERLHQLSF